MTTKGGRERQRGRKRKKRREREKERRRRERQDGGERERDSCHIVKKGETCIQTSKSDLVGFCTL